LGELIVLAEQCLKGMVYSYVLEGFTFVQAGVIVLELPRAVFRSSADLK